MGWRAALLGTVAAGALLFGYGRAARADCVGAATTLTCTGDLVGTGVANGGIGIFATYDTLIVDNLNADITPDPGTIGIYFSTTAAKTATTGATTPVNVTTTGANIDAIRISAIDSVTLSSTGNLSSGGGYGILADSTTDVVDVTSAGTVTAAKTAIRARSGGDDVSVTSTGDLTSYGSHGIHAYSPGTNAITVISDGNIQAAQTAILAESGTGGADAAAVMVTSTGNLTATSGRGIDASSETGDVTVMSTGDVRGFSTGIFAQVTDGPGAIKIYSEGTVTAAGSGIFGLSEGGDVKVVSEGDVTGTNSLGIYAYSRFGPGVVEVTSTGNVMSSREAIKARSDGGDVTIMSTGDATSYSNDAISARSNGSAVVTVTSIGDVTARATGILAFSAGGALTVDSAGDVTSTGGGGFTGYGIKAQSSSGPVKVTSNGNVTSSTRDAINAESSSGNVTVDSTGNLTATSGRGVDATSETGDVTVMSTGDVTGSSTGIFAQSTDGGGAVKVYSEGTVTAAGSGFYVTSETGDVTVVSTGNVTGTNSLGILADSRTGPGVVMVTSTGNVTSSREAIKAQSDGGDVTVMSTGNATSLSNDGIEARSNGSAVVMVTSEGNVTARATGIQAFSSGGALTINSTGDVTSTGGGGFTGYGIKARSSSGPVKVTSNGNVTSSTKEAINAESSSGDIDITLNGGAMYGFSEGVEFVGGDENTLTINNTVSISGGSTDILGGTGDETVKNYGQLTTPGDVDLDGGTNTFNNYAGATFNSGNSVDLGAGNDFVNAGDLSPGGVGAIQTTALTGDFTQYASGSFSVDVDAAGGTADLLDVAGTATLDGLVVPNLVSVAAPSTVTILTTPNANDLTDLGISVNDTLIVDYELLIQNDQNLLLTIAGINFAVGGLNQNQTSIASNINAVVAAGGGGMQDLLVPLVNLSSVANLAAALDQLSPEAYLDTEITSLYAALDFSNNLFSCPVSQGQFAFIREGQCVWVEGGIRSIDQDRTPENFNFDEHTGNVSGGAQVALGGDWFLGGALGYEWGEFETDTKVRSDVDRFSGGVALKYNPGPWLLAGAVSGGGSWYDTTRHIAFPGFTAKATSDHEVTHGSGQLRAAYLMESGAVYLKPQVDVNATYVELDSITETGAGGANLTVAGTDDWVFSVSPALELGAQMGDEHDLVMVRPFVRAGITAFDDTNFQVASTFSAAPTATPFIIRAETDDLTYDVSGGADFFAHGNASLRVSYDGKFGDEVEVHSGAVRGRLGF